VKCCGDNPEMIRSGNEFQWDFSETKIVGLKSRFEVWLDGLMEFFSTHKSWEGRSEVGQLWWMKEVWWIWRGTENNACRMRMRRIPERNLKALN